MTSTRVRLVVEVSVSAPVRDRVALAREILTRQGCHVVEAVAVGDDPHPGQTVPPIQADLFGEPHAE